MQNEMWLVLASDRDQMARNATEFEAQIGRPTARVAPCRWVRYLFGDLAVSLSPLLFFLVGEELLLYSEVT
jgi:hypothetical protein